MLFGSLYVKLNVLTFSSATGVTVTSPFVSGVTVGAVGLICTSIFFVKYALFVISETLSPVTPVRETV